MPYLQPAGAGRHREASLNTALGSDRPASTLELGIWWPMESLLAPGCVGEYYSQLFLSVSLMFVDLRAPQR